MSLEEVRTMLRLPKEITGTVPTQPAAAPPTETGAEDLPDE